jgi:hypothetical protein
MLFGVMAVVAQLSDLGWWGDVWSIVAGVIALTVFLWVCGQWVWRRLHAPKVSVAAGSSDAYRRETIPEQRHRMFLGDIAPYRVYVTRLQVRETNNAEANDVHLRVVRTDPGPTDPVALPAGLQWISGTDDQTLAPKGRAYVRLCEVVADVYLERLGVLTSVPNLKPGEIVWFKVEVVVDGASRETYEFTADWRDEESHYPEVSGA